MTPAEQTPNGCAVCGDAQRCHGTQYHSTTGLHQYIEPTDAQRKQRMLARRMGDHDHEKCCRYLLCAHPACCGYHGDGAA